MPYLERMGIATPEERAYLAELRERNAAEPEWPPGGRLDPNALGVTTLRPIDMASIEKPA